jgi:hypothetical protein
MSPTRRIVADPASGRDQNLLEPDALSIQACLAA